MEIFEELNTKSSSNSDAFDRLFTLKQVKYSEDMWDSLDSLNFNSKRCTKVIKTLYEFLKGITKQAEGMVNGINKLSDNFERDIKSEEWWMDTVTSCLIGLPNRIRTINEIFSSHVKIIQLSVLEELDLLLRNYSQKSSYYLQEWTRYRNDLKTIDK